MPLSSSFDAPNPQRIRTARESRGLSKTELASRIGLTVQALTNFELGHDRPKDENLAKFARELGFNRDYFYGSDFHEINPEVVTFRSRRSLIARVRRMAIARSKHATDLISPAFRERFRLPHLDLPDMAGEKPEEAAQLLRSVWNLGEAPIDNVVHMLESKGIEFYWLKIDSTCVDALSYWVDQRPFVFLNSYKEAGERGRFDAAHELGHLVLHRHSQDVQSKEIEIEADKFASAFLLPAGQFLKEAPRSYLVSDYLRLKPRWKVSVQAMIRRSYDLGLLNRYSYENACRVVSARGWRTKEPDQLQREQSALHFAMLERLAEKRTSPEALAQELHLRLTDFFELVPAAVHFIGSSGLSNL